MKKPFLVNLSFRTFFIVITQGEIRVGVKKELSLVDSMCEITVPGHSVVDSFFSDLTLGHGVPIGPTLNLNQSS